jgi:hypothetical protein
MPHRLSGLGLAADAARRHCAKKFERTRDPMRPVLALRVALLALAGTTTAWGLYAGWRYGWRDLYADQWRLYRQFLALPFPDNVLFLENGHRPVVPNLLRVAEIAWFRGNQSLQWAVGLALAMLTVIVGWATVLRDRTVDAVARDTCALALALAVFWLANSRMLMHPNESVHTYLSTLLVAVVGAVGAPLAARDRATGWELPVCAGCGFIATFSFGPGIALFVALAFALAIVRAPWRRVTVVIAAMLLTLAVYFALPGGQGVANALKLQPWANARVAAQWLSAPIMYLLLPFLDGSYAAALPGEPLQEFAKWTSRAFASHVGDIGHTVWPQALVGGAGIATLVLQSVSRWRDRSATPTQFAGLVYAWFGLGVAGVVSISRLAYFEVHPDQVYANRYLPWPCLFWAGLVLLALGRHRSASADGRGVPRAAVVGAVVLSAIGALINNPIWMDWAQMTQALARHQASAALTDVYSATLLQGDTVPAEFSAGLPAVRAARVAMFAHPAAGRLGTRLTQAPVDLFAQNAVATARPFVSDAGTPALEIEAAIPPSFPRTDADYWVLTDERRVVVGYAHFDPLDSRSRVSGFARGERADGGVLAFPWVGGEGPGQGVGFRLTPRAAP